MVRMGIDAKNPTVREGLLTLRGTPDMLRSKPNLMDRQIT